MSGFKFNDRDYAYFCHDYNQTRKNERAVEIPIILHELNSATGSVMELGRVLPNYIGNSYDVVDKYDSSAGVIKKDVLDFIPTNQYSLIVSISTIEHVGLDEDKKDGEKGKKALLHLKDKCLAKTGRLVLTWPVGYNTDLDRQFYDGELPLSESYALRRISRDNQWEQVDPKNVMGIQYGRPFHTANAIIVGIISPTTREC